MRSIPAIAVLCGLLAASFGARGFQFEYDDFHAKSKLFLHPFVNHEVHPAWLRMFEDGLFSSSIVRVNYGSVTLREMMSDLDVIVNAKLDYGMWFRFHHRTNETHHLNLDEKSNFVGAEKYIVGPLSAFCYADFMLEKEFADVQFGVAVSDSSRSRYARLAVCLEDFMYDSKGHLGASTEKAPYAAVWRLNHAFGRVRLFSEGYWSRGFERRYRDRTRSPEMAYHRQHNRRGLVRCVYAISPRSYVQAELFHYWFGEKKLFHDPALDYRFENMIYYLSAVYCLTLRDMHRFRVGPHVVVNDAWARGYRDYDYTRRDIMPSGAYEFLWRRSVFGISGFASLYRWDVDSYDTGAGSEKQDYVAKAQVTYGLQLWQSAYLRGSYSHVLSLHGFNGWTVQYIMLF